MPLCNAVRRRVTVLLIAALVPAQGFALPLSVGRPVAGDALDLRALQAFMRALNSTDQLAMSGPARPQLYLVYNVDVAVPPAGGVTTLTAADVTWLDDFFGELLKQPAVGTAPAESILDEIAAGDAHVRAMESATRLGSMPDTLSFEANPNESVPVERSMSVAIQDAVQEAGFQDSNTNGGTHYKPGTGTVTYEGQFADGDIIVTGQLVDGRIVLTKQFKPLTGSGGVGDPVTVRGGGTRTSTTTTAANTTSAAAPAAPATAATPIATAAPPAPAASLRVVANDGSPGDAVYMSQPFRVEAAVPAGSAPPVLTATLSTPDGQQQTITLVPQNTQNGVTTFSSPTISFHGGRIAPGTLQGLDVSNGQIVTVTAPNGTRTGVAVYTDDVQLGISRVNDALNATSEELIRQRSYVDAQMRDPVVAADAAQMQNLQQWRADIDEKIAWIRQTRELMAGTDLPGLQLMYGQRRFSWLTANWDDFDRRQWSGDFQIREEFKEKAFGLYTEVMRGFTMGAYQQVARMSMIAQLRTVATGYNEFNEKLTYEQLLAENKGLAFDLAMFWVPGKFTQFLEQGGRFTGEIVISGGAPAGRILVPPRAGAAPGRTATTSTTRTTTTAIPTGPRPSSTPTQATGGKPAAAGERGVWEAGTKPANADDALNRANTRQTAQDVEMAANEVEAEIRLAREAGVSEQVINEMTAGYKPDGLPLNNRTIAENLMTERLQHMGYDVNMTPAEYQRLQGMSVRSGANGAGLTADDMQFLHDQLAANPAYFDTLSTRGYVAPTAKDVFYGRTQPQEGFIAGLNSEAAGNLRDAYVRNGGVLPDATPTVRLNPQDTTPTVRLAPGATAPTVRLGPEATAPTVKIDPAATAPTVRLGSEATAPTVRVDPATAPTVRLGPEAPTVRLGPEATAPTVKLGPEATAPTVRLGPEATAPTVKMDPNATARIADDVTQRLPQARQSGMTPLELANTVRSTMAQSGVAPQQLVNTLRQRLLRPIAMHDLGDPATAAARAGADVSLEAIGVSSGVAFTMRASNSGAVPVHLQGEGIVVEPVRAAAPAPTAGGPSAPIATDQVEAFCLERVRPVATRGMEYRVAPPSIQAQHRGLVDVLHAAKRVMDAGGLHPDSEVKGYFNFIRQWSIWSRQEKFDEKRFTEEFLNQTKKNVASQGAKWTGAMEDTVKRAAPGRWRDISSVLDAANQPKTPSAAAPSPGPVAIASLMIHLVPGTPGLATGRRRLDCEDAA